MSVPKRSLFALFASAAIAAGCGTAPQQPPEAALPRDVTAFSQSLAGSNLPKVWQPWRLSRFKSPSSYQLVEDSGRTVILASARASASGLIHYLNVDPHERPILSWRWKVTDLPITASSADDSPARIVVSFDGDHEKLDFSDRLFYSQFRLFTGQQLPYAALMYVWGSHTPKEGIVPNKHTTRIKLIVVESGRDKLGQWQDARRDIVADFRRTFGEEPGKVISVGILTEADAADRTLNVYYGDLEFSSRPAGSQ